MRNLLFRTPAWRQVETSYINIENDWDIEAINQTFC